MKPVELLAPIGVSGAIAVLALSDVPLLYAPFAIGLLLAAVGVFWLLGIVLVALLSQRGWSCRTWGDLAPLALTSLIAAIVTVGALSWLRFAAEQLYRAAQVDIVSDVRGAMLDSRAVITLSMNSLVRGWRGHVAPRCQRR